MRGKSSGVTSGLANARSSSEGGGGGGGGGRLGAAGID